MDREKVIAGLTMLADRKNDDTCEGLKCCKIAADALALLKEQDDLGTELTNPVELIHEKYELIEKLLKEQETTSTGKTRIFQCEKCGYGIDDIYLSNEHDFDVYPHFCPYCGRSVKWE